MNNKCNKKINDVLKSWKPQWNDSLNLRKNRKSRVKSHWDSNASLPWIKTVRIFVRNFISYSFRYRQNNASQHILWLLNTLTEMVTDFLKYWQNSMQIRSLKRLWFFVWSGFHIQVCRKSNLIKSSSSTACVKSLCH